MVTLSAPRITITVGFQNMEIVFFDRLDCTALRLETKIRIQTPNHGCYKRPKLSDAINANTNNGVFVRSIDIEREPNHTIDVVCQTEAANRIAVAVIGPLKQI